MQTLKRIEFIDLAKGICILMVLFFHIGIPDVPGIKYMRMPFYFVLSGLFFSDYGGFNNLLLKKTNKIFVPFLFFYVVSYFYFYLIRLSFPEYLPSNVHGILDIFRSEWIYNGPIWFLLSLFWVNIIFYFVNKYGVNNWGRGVLVVLCAFLGYTLGKEDVYIIGYVATSLTSIPYFYVGYLLKQTNLLLSNKLDKYNLLFFVVFYSLALVMERYTSSTHIWYLTNDFHGFPPIVYIRSLFGVFAILALCKVVKHLPLVSYLGRYSIVVLVLHRIVYRPIQILFTNVLEIEEFISNCLTAVVVVSLFYFVLIPFCLKYIPKFISQKDLIEEKDILRLKNVIFKRK